MLGRRSIAAGAAALTLLAAAAAAATPARATPLAPADHAVQGCGFMPAATEMPGEGAPDLRRALPATGTLRVTMLFVTLPGIAPSESPQAIADALVGPAQHWFATASYGRAQLAVDVVPRWLRATAPTFPAAVAAASANGVDLTHARAVVAVLPEETRMISSYEQVVPNGRIRFGVVLAPYPTATAARDPALWTILTHELAHVLGLPDLYVTAGNGALSAVVGPWDPMSLPLGQHVLAWHALQLGWLDPTDVRCVFSGAQTQLLSPVETPGGVKAVVVPLSATSAIVVEARTRTGLDSGLCADGVLAYDVDTASVPDAPPVRVLASGGGSSGACGPLSTATLAPGASLVDAGVRIDVLAREQGGYLVRISR